MKSFGLLIIIILLLFGFVQTRAQNGPFGLGIIVGEPTGVSAKLWISKTTAIDLGLGWGISDFFSDLRNNGINSIHIHADYLIHAYNLISDNGQYPFYFGIGGGIDLNGGNASLYTLRFVCGVSWMPSEVPFDFFAEIAMVPTFKFSSEAEFVLETGLGIRYYF